jgi:formiminotetrahydrofolate cyclodeaminase
MTDEVNLEDLLNNISSDSPAPGGGSVAAVSGSFGAALISMVCRLSIGKKKYEDVAEELKNVLSEAEYVRDELLSLSKEDVDAYNDVVEAYKIPDSQKKKEQLQRAYKKAAAVPMEVAKKCQRILELAEITTNKGNQNAITDSGVGALMAYSGLKSALLNVKVNLKYIEDSGFIKEYRDEVDSIEKRANEIIEEIMVEIRESLHP